MAPRWHADFAVSKGPDARTLLLKKEFKVDLRAFYQKIRHTEAGIADDHVVIISRETSDGGRAGVASEVARPVAARLVVEGRAVLASKEEAAAFRTAQADAFHKAEQAAAASRVQLAVIAETELRALKERTRPQKG
jgi:hypothetical protein